MRRATLLTLLLLLLPGRNASGQKSDGTRISVQGGEPAHDTVEKKEQPSQPLTNDSIVKLVKAGLGEDTIIKMVDTQPGEYSLGVEDIIALKNAGVSEKIIAAMLNKSANGQVRPTSSLPAAGPLPGESGPANPPPTPVAVPAPRLSEIKTVFVKGNNEASVKARENLEKRTCYHLAPSEAKADAVLELDWSVRGGRVSGVLTTTKGGEVIWSGVSSGEVFRPSYGRAGEEVDLLFRKLQNDGWPGSVRSFHGLDRSVCGPFGKVNAMEEPAEAQTGEGKPASPTQETATGTVNVTSNPGGADVYVDGQLVGGCPAVLKLKAGKHIISAKLSGHKDWSREITVEPGSEVQLIVRLEQ
jgi:hypothetical protein